MKRKTSRTAEGDFNKRVGLMIKSINKAGSRYGIVIKPVILFDTRNRTLLQRFIIFLLKVSKAKMDFNFIDVIGRK